MKVQKMSITQIFLIYSQHLPTYFYFIAECLTPTFIKTRFTIQAPHICILGLMVLEGAYGLKIREIQIKTSDQDHAGAC